MSKEEKDKVIRQIYYDADSGFGSIAETYKASKKVLNSLNKISKTDSSILLSGLEGSGREFLARKIHSESNRNNKRFKVIDFSFLNKIKKIFPIF